MLGALPNVSLRDTIFTEGKTEPWGRTSQLSGSLGPEHPMPA